MNEQQAAELVDDLIQASHDFEVFRKRSCREKYHEIRLKVIEALTPMWQTNNSAPRDGRTFYAMRWHESFEGSLHWALLWNGNQFETADCGAICSGEDFTHWIIPDTSPLPSHQCQSPTGE